MSLKFHLNYFIAFILLLATEVGIALFLKTGFIRHSFGDYLVVILIYCFFRSFLKPKPIYLALFVLAFAFVVEFLQLFNLLDLLQLRQNKFAVIVLGSTFHVSDLIAYMLGIITIYIIDNISNKHHKILETSKASSLKS